MTIKIILIDDHTLFRSGIKALLSRQHGFEVIGEAADGLSGIKMISRLQPDVVLLDLDMPGMNGREALSQIISINPQQAVIMLTVSEDSDDLTECMRIGARGYLLKNINADFLLESIRKAAEGDNVFSPEMTAKLVKSLISPNLPKGRRHSPHLPLVNWKSWAISPQDTATKSSPATSILPNPPSKSTFKTCSANSTSAAGCRPPFTPSGTTSPNLCRNRRSDGIGSGKKQCAPLTGCNI